MAIPLGTGGLPRSDAALVTATLTGDRAAFEQLVQRYDRPARAACYAVLRDWHLAQDAAQEGFVAAYQNLRSVRDPVSFGPWLLTIMHRRALHLAQSRRPTVPLHLQPDPPAAAPAEPEVGQVIAAVSRLPDHERAVVMLHYFEGHDVGTISRICECPVGTVTMQLSRARRRLLKTLAKGG